MSSYPMLSAPSLGESVSTDLSGSLGAHRAAFEQRYGAADGVRTFFSPGRVNLFGGHLDYNGGPVLPTAIDRGTFVAIRPREDGEIRMASRFAEVEGRFQAAELPVSPRGEWFDYPLGVMLALIRLEDSMAAKLAGGFDVLFGGNLPVGAGLSSSASICVGTTFALDALFGLGLDPVQRVEAALDAERGFVGVKCGIMDPYAVGFARPKHVLWLDCKDETFEHLPMDFERLSIGVVDTGIQRLLARGEFNRRVTECAAAFEALRIHAPEARVLRDISRTVLAENGHELDADLLRRATHVVEEVERTFVAREALLSGDLETLGRCMTETHISLRDRYDCSCEELDALVEAATEKGGALGARLTGAGFGGCAVMLIAAGDEQRVSEAVVGDFERRYGRRPPIAFFQGDEGPREIR